MARHPVEAPVEAAQAPKPPPAPERVPEPPATLLGPLTLDTVDFPAAFRVPADDDQAQVCLMGTGPADTHGTWQVLSSADVSLKHGEFATRKDGKFFFEVHIEGPQDCLRIRLDLAGETVISPLFDLILHDEPDQPRLDPAEQELRRSRHRGYVEASRATPGSPPLPFRGPLVMSSDPRLQLARELAGRGLTHASLNDLAKAVLLLIDLHVEKDPKQTQIGRDALEGKAPPLL